VFKKSVGLTLFLILNSFKFRPQLIHFPLQGYMGSICQVFFPCLPQLYPKFRFCSKIAIGLCEFHVALNRCHFVACDHCCFPSPHIGCISLQRKTFKFSKPNHLFCTVSKTSHPLILLNTELILSNIWLSVPSFEHVNKKAAFCIRWIEKLVA
jgi:hypothetical protein